MKTLGHVPICGMEVPLRSGTEKDCQDPKGAYGCYVVDTATIWMDQNVPPHAGPFWCTHEALHALLNNSGALRMTAALLDQKIGSVAMERWEENLIRVLTPHIIETFGAAKVFK